MNLILASLLLFILLLPGILFRGTYFKSDNWQSPMNNAYIGELVYIVSAALFLHTIGIWFVAEFVQNHDFKLEQLYLLIKGSGKSEGLYISTSIQPYWNMFMFYIFSLCISGSALGYVGRWVAIFTGIEKNKFFRVSNQWRKYSKAVCLRRRVTDSKGFTIKHWRSLI